MYSVDEIIKLHDAGFSAEDIKNLSFGMSEGNAEGAKPIIKEEKPIQPMPEVKEDGTKKEEPKSFEAITDAQIEKLAQLINVGKSSIDVPPTKDINTILADRFLNAIGGTKTKED